MSRLQVSLDFKAVLGARWKSSLGSNQTEVKEVFFAPCGPRFDRFRAYTQKEIPG